MTKWIMIIVLAAALAPVGCGKSNTAPPPPPPVTINVPKLRDAFATASPELKALSDDAIKYVQYGRNYPAGLTDLDKLANSPGLTDDQKKAVDEVTGQVKQLMNGAAAPPAR